MEQKRNLAFYKRSGEDWTKEELLRIPGSWVKAITGELPEIVLTRKWVYDNNSTKTDYMYPWLGQEEDYGFTKCDQLAYEDVFGKSNTPKVGQKYQGGIYIGDFNGKKIIIAEQDAPEKLNFTDAKEYCSNLDLNGHTDWYLPSMDELKFAYENARDLMKARWYWSSAEVASQSAQYQNFDTGGQFKYFQAGACFVRPFRSVLTQTTKQEDNMSTITKPSDIKSGSILTFVNEPELIGLQIQTETFFFETASGQFAGSLSYLSNVINDNMNIVSYAIDEIWEPKFPTDKGIGSTLNSLMQRFRTKKFYTKIWERPAEEMTLAQVEQALGKKIKLIEG
jgi:hypothetical protein